MDNPILYRKRLIPNECIPLKDDIILHADDKILVTKWKTLKPRDDFHHGYSCYFFHDGFKISKFYRNNGTFVYWYCDIVSYSFEREKNVLIVTDLLVDVIIMPDGNMKVLDIDELCEAKEKGLLSESMFYSSVKCLGNLIKKIETKEFDKYVSLFEQHLSENS